MWKKLNSTIRSITRKSKSSFYYSFQILPPEKKAAIYSVYSFCRLTDDIVDSEESIDIRSNRLQEWEKKLSEAIKNGQSENPVLDGLSQTIRSFSIPVNYFYELIDGARMDLEERIYHTFDELYRYCYKVASVVGFMSIHIFGFSDEKSIEYAENLGIALQLTNIIRDVGKDAEMNRIYIPDEDLNKFQIRKNDILEKRMTNEFREMMIFQYQRALSYYQRAASLLPQKDRKNLIPSEIMGKTYFALLNKIKKNKFNVFSRFIKINENRKRMIALFTWLKISMGPE